MSAIVAMEGGGASSTVHRQLRRRGERRTACDRGRAACDTPSARQQKSSLRQRPQRGEQQRRTRRRPQREEPPPPPPPAPPAPEHENSYTALAGQGGATRKVTSPRTRCCQDDPKPLLARPRRQHRRGGSRGEPGAVGAGVRGARCGRVCRKEGDKPTDALPPGPKAAPPAPITDIRGAAPEASRAQLELVSEKRVVDAFAASVKTE